MSLEALSVNEKDQLLAHSINTILDDDSFSSLYVLNAKFTNTVRVDLVLLKVFLEVKHRKGLMITIDRPHQYVSHLMQLHGVDQTDLTFLDAISMHAADTKGGAVVPELQKGPFQIDTLPEYLANATHDGLEPVIDTSNIEFVIIDNVSILQTYNTMDSIKRFLERYVEVSQSLRDGGIQTAVVIDRELHPDLFRFVSSLARKSIDISPDMVVKEVTVMDVPTPSVGMATPVLPTGPSETPHDGSRKRKWNGHDAG